MGTFLIIFFIVITPITIISYLKYKQIENSKGVKVETINQKDRLAVSFYEECQKRGITSMSDAKSIETALEILQYNASFSNVSHDTVTAQNLFNQGKAAIDDLNKRKQDNENERKRREEEKESQRRLSLGVDAYKVIEAARKREITDELFSGALIFVADIFQNDIPDVKDGYHYLYVFKGISGYYSYIPDTDSLTEGFPNLYVKHMYNETYTKEPDQLIFTAATVGGVTTGGFDVAKGGYKRHIDMTGGYSVFIGYGSMRQVHNIINNMWCDDEMLKYLEYNGAGSFHQDKPVYGALNYIPKITAPSSRTLVVGERSKEACNILVNAMKR